jgi:DNA-directed RNA polymerase subunit RPC12/RpoP
MKLIEFFNNYPNEAECKAKFKEIRERQGVICKQCKTRDNYWWLKSKEQYECKNCGFRMSIKSGTVMENSKLPYQYWFIAFHLMTSTKKTISALEMQRQLGHDYYECIWAMMHKIRLVMGKRDDLYQLSDKAEIDESYYSTKYIFEKDEFTGQQEKLKRGKGSQKKTSVLVMASQKRVKRKQVKKDQDASYIMPKFLKMKVVENGTIGEIQTTTEKNITKSSSIKADKARAYPKSFRKYEKVELYDMSKHESGKVLPWSSKAITNSKNLIKAIHHAIENSYLQNYLNEFCFKYNRRYFGEKVFDRLLVAAVSFVWY